jgi:outer membrane lipoprotein-sorting protein
MPMKTDPRPLPQPPQHREPTLARRFAAAVGFGFVGLTVTACVTVAHAQGDAAFDLGQLMRTLAQTRAGTATFTEKRSVAMLDRTLESTGRLSFEAPDRFTRETLKPRRDKLAVVGNTLTMSQGTRSRTVALDTVPEAAVVIDAIRGTLTGNREALDRGFTSTVAGNARAWTLDLVPRDWRLREQVASVRIAGQQEVVREVTVAMADGDRSVMTIVPAAPAAAGSAP